jgi:hypothetical protein
MSDESSNPSAALMLTGASLYTLRVPPLDEITSPEIRSLAMKVRGGELDDLTAAREIASFYPDEILEWVDFNYQIDNMTTHHIEETNTGIIKLAQDSVNNKKDPTK